MDRINRYQTTTKQNKAQTVYIIIETYYTWCLMWIPVWIIPLSSKERGNPAPFMMTSSNGNIFCVTGHLCGEFTGLQWIPRTKASDAELCCFFYLCLNKRLRKQSRCWWFETLSRPLWRHGNVNFTLGSTFPHVHDRTRLKCAGIRSNTINTTKSHINKVIAGKISYWSIYSWWSIELLTL